jgi:DNA-binding NarL/FixJ family response regulator
MITNRRFHVVRISRCRGCGDAFQNHLGGNCEFEVSLVDDHDSNLLATLEAIQPDVIVLDADVGGGAFDLAKVLQHRFPGTKLVFVLAAHSDICIKQALALGVDGILSAQESCQSLAEHVRQIVGGELRFSPQIVERIVCNGQPGKYQLKNNTPIDSLTPLQLEILRHLARGDSLKMVASKMNLSRKSVDGHKYRIMKKIGVQDRVLLSRFAIREGLIEP